MEIVVWINAKPVEVIGYMKGKKYRMDNYNNNQSQYGQYNLGTQQVQQQQNYQGEQGYNVYQFNQNAYQNAYYNTMPSISPKKSKKKWIIFATIMVALIAIIASVLLVMHFLKTYDIKDYQKIAEISEEVLGLELEKTDKEHIKGLAVLYSDSIVNLGYGSTIDGNRMIMWVEYGDEESAEIAYNKVADNFQYAYENVKKSCDDYGWVCAENIIELSYVKKKDESSRNRQMMVKQDNYILVVKLIGEKSEVDKIYDEFKDEIK
ncbi:MAG: hypothetical protein U0L79_09775 [Lachnospiraceae bacterium]|nr:hypothetical protein [Lachnospiraceae bacterium]